jgi:photosystem II stability/assembly factor-like uncharacterized protein
MRYTILLALLAAPAFSESILYATAAFTKEYVVGARLPASGVFFLEGASWKHVGYNLPIVTAISPDPSDASSLLVAAGNGLTRVSRKGDRWTILTDHEVTELRDIALAGSAVYFAHSAGVRVSRDNGATWTELAGSLRRKYTEAVRVTKDGTLLAAGESGVWRYDGKWQLAGGAGWQILRMEVSPHDGCFIMAATQGGGLLYSRDCGRTFEHGGPLGAGRNIYDIAFDPARQDRIAIGGFGTGVAVSNDGGKTWQSRNAGLPLPDVTAVVFDPARPGRLYAAVHEEALFVSEDAGATWTKAGLDGAHVNCLRFIPEGR